MAFEMKNVFVLWYQEKFLSQLASKLWNLGLWSERLKGSIVSDIQNIPPKVNIF